MNEISPKEFGQLTAEVAHLKDTVQKMSSQIDTLMALVNQGRGAFWLAVFVGGAISSAVTFIAGKLSFFSGMVK
jgi:hypothetical protein